MTFLVTVAIIVTAPPSGGAAARVGEATAAIVKAVHSRGKEAIANADAVARQGWMREERLAFFGEAARLVDQGRRELARVELEAAAGTLDKAAAIYAAHAALPGAIALWGEAEKWRGVALYELKRRDDATAAFGGAKAAGAQLTEAMVRPEVANAYAATAATKVPETTPAGDPLFDGVGVDEVLDSAIAIDAGVLTYAGVRRRRDCATGIVTATRADELVRRLDEAECKAGAPADPTRAAAIAHPRPAPSLTKVTTPRRERTPAWRRPLVWFGVVGALGVGVVLAIELWPRAPSYSVGAAFHDFALR